MKYLEAFKIADANKHLVGKVWNNDVIDEILIAPTDPKERNDFERRYVQTLDAHESIIPFMSSDVEVIIVFNKKMIREIGLFSFISIDMLPKGYNVKLTTK